MGHHDSEAGSILITSCDWMLQNIHHSQPTLQLDSRSMSKQRHPTSAHEPKPPNFQLMRLPRNPPRRPRLNWSLLLQTASTARRLRLRGKFLQRIHRDTILECGLIRSVQEDLRNDRVILPLCSLHGLLPPRSAQAPFAAGLEADGSQIIPARGTEVEEFFCQDAGNGVVPTVFGPHATVAVTVEACHWFLGEEGEGFFEDV